MESENGIRMVSENLGPRSGFVTQGTPENTSSVPAHLADSSTSETGRS